MEKVWEKLDDEKKQKIIQAINERSDYEWKVDYWPKVAFKLLPPLLKKEVEKELKRLKNDNF